MTREYPEKSAEELKFGTGAEQYEQQKKKIYHIDMQSAAINICKSLTGTITVIDKTGQPVTPPSDDGENYAYEYPLKGEPISGGCRLKITDTLANKIQSYFIVSNRSRKALDEGWFNFNVSDKAVLYGGIGNQVRVQAGEAVKYIPIEPVGVIVLGIDGLRQDVLYAPPGGTNDGTNVFSTYTDPNGCGTNASCYVEPANLTGLCDVLGGKFDGMISTHCDSTGWDNKHIKLKDVTAIFPSITLASWASIFTGKMPNETGITGNEFFARDLYKNGQGAPSKKDGSLTPLLNPAGIVSFDSGAFKGYDIVGPGSNDFFIPSQFSWTPSAQPGLTPQNDRRVLTANETIFENVSEQPEVQKYLKGKGADAVTVAYSHYARGASNWLTFNYFITSLSWTEASTMDKASWNRFEEYLNGKYLTSKVRNNVPFSPLTVWYLSGLDHKAHISGMEKYKDYFKDTTDDYILNLTKWLQSNDEFENKIFIVVADHGHTAMPTELTYPLKLKKIDPEGNEYTSDVVYPAETSCELKLNFTNYVDDNLAIIAQNAELNNNNLHIWELGKVFKVVGDRGWANFKVLAPEKISALFKDKSSMELPYGATSDINKANVITALNGPMAHIYIKGMTGWQDKIVDAAKLAELAGYLKVILMQNGASLNETEKESFKNLLSSIDTILIRDGGIYKIFNGVKTDSAGNITGPDTATIDANSFDAGKYIAAMRRIEGMNNVDRSGDIVLIMKDDLNIPQGESIDTHRYTTGVACKSWHGSLNPSDSYVPFIVSYPGGNINEIRPFIENVQGCSVANGCEGNWKITDVIKEIIKTQYSAQ